MLTSQTERDLKLFFASLIPLSAMAWVSALLLALEMSKDRRPAIEDAVVVVDCERDLARLCAVMHGYRSNSCGPQKKRLRNIDDAAEDAASSDLPKWLRDAVDKRRLELRAPPLPGRSRAGPTSGPCSSDSRGLRANAPASSARGSCSSHVPGCAPSSQPSPRAAQSPSDAPVIRSRSSKGRPEAEVQECRDALASTATGVSAKKRPQARPSPRILASALPVTAASEADGQIAMEPTAKKRRTRADGSASDRQALPSSSSSMGAPQSLTDEASRRSLQSSLATLFAVSEDRVSSIRRGGDLFSLVDVTSIVTGCNNDDAAKRIREVLRQHPDVRNRVPNLKFQGRGQRDTPVGNLYTVVEFIMLLPGKNAASMRRQAAELFVRYHGGDLSVAEEVMAARERQDEMRVDNPGHPMRCFGGEVERVAGGTSEQVGRLEETLREGGRRQTAYDPVTLSQKHHEHKDMCNRELVEGMRRVFGRILPGYVAVLDDLNGESPPAPRTAKALRDAGVPLSRILAPNKESSVVQALQNFGVVSMKKHFSWAFQEEYREHNVSAAYIDTCSGNLTELERMVDCMRLNNKEGHLVLGYTIVLRCFTEGGAKSFTQRVLHMTDYMHSIGFEPLKKTLDASYFEYNDKAQRVGTAFWMKPRDPMPFAQSTSSTCGPK